jgi:hypothetical protein
MLFSAAPVGAMSPAPGVLTGPTLLQVKIDDEPGQDHPLGAATLVDFKVLHVGSDSTDPHGSVTFGRVIVTGDAKGEPAGGPTVLKWAAPVPIPLDPEDRERFDSWIAHLADVVFNSRSMFDAPRTDLSESPAWALFSDHVRDALHAVDLAAPPISTINPSAMAVPISGQVGVTGELVGPVLTSTSADIPRTSDERTTPPTSDGIATGIFTAVKLSGQEIATRAVGLLNDFLPADQAIIDRAVCDLLDRLDAMGVPVEEWSPEFRARAVMTMAVATTAVAVVAVNRECRERLASWWPRLKAGIGTVPDRPGTTRV